MLWGVARRVCMHAALRLQGAGSAVLRWHADGGVVAVRGRSECGHVAMGGKVGSRRMQAPSIGLAARSVAGG